MLGWRQLNAGGFGRGFRDWKGILDWVRGLKGSGAVKASLTPSGPRLRIDEDDCRYARLIGSGSPYTAVEVHPLPGGLWEDTPNGLIAGDVFELNNLSGLDTQIARVCRDFEDWRFEFVRDGTHGCTVLNIIVRDCGGVPINGATVHVTGPGGFDWTGTTDAAGYAYVPIPSSGPTYHVEVTSGSDSDSADIDTSVVCIWGFCLGGRCKIKVTVFGCCGYAGLGTGYHIGPGVVVNFYDVDTLVGTGTTDANGTIEKCMDFCSDPYSRAINYRVESPPARYAPKRVDSVASTICQMRTLPGVFLDAADGYWCFSCCPDCPEYPMATEPCGPIDVSDPYTGISAHLDWMPPGSDYSFQSPWYDWSFPGCVVAYTYECPPLGFKIRYSVAGCNLFVEVLVPHYDRCTDVPDCPSSFPAPIPHTCPYVNCPIPTQCDGLGGPPLDWILIRDSHGLIPRTGIEFLSCPPGFSGTATMTHPASFCPATATTFTLTES